MKQHTDQSHNAATLVARGMSFANLSRFWYLFFISFPFQIHSLVIKTALFFAQCTRTCGNRCRFCVGLFGQLLFHFFCFLFFEQK